ncbi:MAG: DUF3090 domain-containing protein [Actinobacteria bacterium]|nr:DUF3090 domain-containing protein [Actinomycetota bacterium]NBY14765.1 DUF3090 domain-containing protein [Actinomycetota bacterium]
MTRFIYLFDEPERFVAGTVGLPGEREFFLQARLGSRLTTVALEKTQVYVLADRIGDLLDQIAQDEGIDTSSTTAADLEPLDNPIQQEFTVGALSLGWNPQELKVIIEAHAFTEDDADVPELEDDGELGPDVMRVRLTPKQARSFSTRALAVVAAGRPPCPLCDGPLDARGHICPRANGYRRRG